MIEPKPWFDRPHFASEQPVWLFPNIVERLRGTPARLEDRFAAFAPETLDGRPPRGWSAREHLAHLIVAEGVWRDRLGDFDAGVETPQFSLPTPDDVAALRPHARPVEELLGDFRRARKALVARLEGMDEGAVERSFLNPRRQRRTRLIDLMFYAAEHDDHHLVSLTRLEEALRTSTAPSVF